MSELAGDLSLVLNLIALILVAIGVVGRKGSQKVLMRHGYLSILGFVIKLATVFAVMIPALLVEPLDLVEFSSFQLGIIWVKVALGILGDVMGFVCIVPWFLKPIGQMYCNRVKRWMLPTFVVWVVSIVLGVIIHLGGIL